jgi:hypothetical protein
MSYSKDAYPDFSEYDDVEKAEEHLCKGLNILLDTILSDPLKKVSIGHAITQAARPRSVISPIMFGLGVELHHQFGAEWLNNHLSSLGFCVSYDEITRFRQSVLLEQNLDSLSPPSYPVLSQYGADNIDDNIKTLTGKGTFHAMAHYAWFRKQKTLDKSGTRVKRMPRVEVDQLLERKIIYQLSAMSMLRVRKQHRKCDSWL